MCLWCGLACEQRNREGTMHIRQMEKNVMFRAHLPFSFTSYAEVMCLIIICYVQASGHMICTYKVSGSIPDEVIF
jgi:hypothetical protein